jgi:glyoxylase-like metal-dependent hydrolase (beta-lactamase superfamily II)
MSIVFNEGSMLFDRRRFLQASAGAAAASVIGLPLTRDASAKAPLATAQTPSFYRFKVGTLEVTAVADGLLEIPLALFPGATAELAEAKALLAKAHRPEKPPIGLNTYFVNTGEKLILVDTGYGNGAGPAGGALLSNIAAAGYTPDQVDAVYITHLHPDHVGGLLDAAGAPVFAKADLLVSEKDHAFWTDEGIMSRAPESAQKFFKIAQGAVKGYAKSLHLYKDSEQIAPGLTAVGAPGHTPGHSMLQLASGNDSLLIWGDIVHLTALQFARPDWAIAFDNDAAQAIETRKKLFDRVSSDGTLIAGMHLDFPGVGYVSREAQGYSFQRAMWSPKL